MKKCKHCGATIPAEFEWLGMCDKCVDIQLQDELDCYYDNVDVKYICQQSFLMEDDEYD